MPVVDLGLEAVEDDDLVAPRDSVAHEMRADESGSAGDESLHAHTTSEGRSQLQLAARPRRT